MKKDIFKNVSNMSDEEINKFQVWLNLSRTSMIFTKNGVVAREIGKELNLKVLSCNYGSDSCMYTYGLPMQRFIGMLEDKYGKVFQYDEALGFALRLLFVVDEKECIYTIGAGNNGQEVVTSMFLKDMSVLDNNEFKEILCDLDAEMFSYIDKSGLEKY